jgi:hypothetical protein
MRSKVSQKSARRRSSCSSAELTIKELAAALPHGHTGKPRTRGYVSAMKKAGFQMPNKRATLAQAKRWLRLNPTFSWRKMYLRGGEQTL